MRRRWAAALASAAVVAVTAIGAPSALATPPVSLGSGYVVDDADVLSPAEESAAQARLEQLKADSGLDLWVVFVDEFTDPSSSEEWANQTAEDNGLGPTQYLLAVSTEGRQYYLSADSAGPVSPEQVASIEQQRIQPALQQNDWPGAVDAAADGLADASSGGTGGTGSGGAGGSSWFTWLLVVAVAVIAVILLVMFLRRRRRPAAPGGPATPPVEQVSVEELERQAASALIETDDAVKTSAQELQFAEAQFGKAATVEFEQALAQARANLDEAFTLKQQLDDATPDSPQDVRAWNARIIALCEQANTALDDKAEAFDELRRLEQNAPEALATITAEADRAEASLGAATAKLQALRSSYAPEALATIDDNPDQAKQRLAFAREQLTAARTALNAGDRGEAAVGIRAAEDAVGQAVLLEQAIDKLAADLEAGEHRAAALITELERDLIAARGLPDSDGRVAAVVAATTQQIDTARTQLSGTAKRPLAALQALEAANEQIDTLVQGIRDAEAQAQRARQMVGQVILQAQAQVSAAEDYITARRGAVGAPARTRLAEAGAALVRAQQLQASDPQQAMQHAQRADQLAGQAIQLAQSDVGSFSGGGMFGGGSTGGGGDNMLGAVLGGILINSMMGGGRSSGGGFGGGLGGGLGGMLGGSGGRGGGIRPGSFGGGGTRGRRGGGRF